MGYTVKKKFKFELVEKIIIKLDKTFQDKSFMVVDGQFICLDPYLGTKYHLLSSNKYSKIEISSFHKMYEVYTLVCNLSSSDTDALVKELKNSEVRISFS